VHKSLSTTRLFSNDLVVSSSLGFVQNFQIDQTDHRKDRMVVYLSMPGRKIVGSLRKCLNFADCVGCPNDHQIVLLGLLSRSDTNFGLDSVEEWKLEILVPQFFAAELSEVLKS
jgi:hypothetical protein